MTGKTNLVTSSEGLPTVGMIAHVRLFLRDRLVLRAIAEGQLPDFVMCPKMLSQITRFGAIYRKNDQ